MIFHHYLNRLKQDNFDEVPKMEQEDPNQN